MKNHFLLVYIFLSLFSCTKSDNNSDVLNEEVIKPIGLNYFGESVNSSEAGVEIFKNNPGYISFENHNLTDDTSREGDSDIVLRKLNDSLQTIEEYVYDTNTYDVLSNAVKLEVNKFALAGRRQVNSPLSEFNAVPFIQIVDDSGNIINSVILEGANNMSITSLVRVFHKNNILYVAVKSGLNFFTIYALDMELNTIWDKTISVKDAFLGKIFVDEMLYFATQTESDLNNNKNVITLYTLNLTTGDLIDTFSYDEAYDNYGIADLLVEGNDLYIFGGASVLSGSAGFILKINKVDGQKQEYLFVNNMNSVSDIKIQGSNILVAGNTATTSGNFIQKLDSNNEEVWSYNSSPVKVQKLLVKDDEAIVFIGKANLINSSGRSSDVGYGIINSMGELQ